MLRKPLRLWPGVVAAVLLVLPEVCRPDSSLDMPGSIGCCAALGGFAVILLWWLFFSRAPWSERLAHRADGLSRWSPTQFLVHESMTGGAMGDVALSRGCRPRLASHSWLAVATPRTRPPGSVARLMVAAIFACGVWTLLRTEGVTSDGRFATPVALDADGRGKAPGPRPTANRRRRRRAPAAACPRTLPSRNEGKTPAVPDPRGQRRRAR